MFDSCCLHLFTYVVDTQIIRFSDSWDNLIKRLQISRSRWCVLKYTLKYFVEPGPIGHAMTDNSTNVWLVYKHIQQRHRVNKAISETISETLHDLGVSTALFCVTSVSSVACSSFTSEASSCLTRKHGSTLGMIQRLAADARLYEHDEVYDLVVGANGA